MMRRFISRIDRGLYPHYSDNWDNALFRELLLTALGPQSDVLDLGAGSGYVRQMNLRGVAGCVRGIDPDQRVLDNPNQDEAKIGSGESIPYPAATFDLVFSNNVLEHLESPARVFREIARVLRPGGRFFGKTPNARHYVPVVARLTSQCLHETVNRLRGRAEADTFPTLYRANTPGRIRHYAELAGL
ncbi:MAG: hypothetical protein AUK55_05430 [Syntrophobacteraceae bacterium CG2_30_61_12]|nr:MAG: hypothetical protein AUK55_05430 [Syntrophobacteraceae bacterium CG2_30_61_12]